MGVLTAVSSAGQGIYGQGDLTDRQALQTLGGLSIVAPSTVLAGVTTGIGDIPWGTFTLPTFGFSRLQALLSVTAAATAVGDTLDVFVDASPDVGTTWMNIIHFAQVLGNGGAVAYYARTPAAAAGITGATGSDLAAAATPLPFVGDMLRVRTKRAQATATSFTVNLVLTALP